MPRKEFESADSVQRDRYIFVFAYMYVFIVSQQLTQAPFEAHIVYFEDDYLRLSKISNLKNIMNVTSFKPFFLNNSISREG